MPLFLFISGIFFKSTMKSGLTDMLVKKSKRLLLPVLFYSSLLISISVIIRGRNSLTLAFLYKQFIYYWFLICLFFLNLIYYAFSRSKKYVKVIMILAYLGGVVGYDYLPGVVLKDCQVIRHILIFGIGLYLGIPGVNKFRPYTLPVIITCVIVIILDRSNWGTNMMDYPAYIRIFDQLACTIIAFLLCYNFLSGQKNRWISKPLIYLGQNSLSIYLIHMMFPRIMLYANYHISCSINNFLILIFLWLLVSVFLTEVVRRIAKSYSFIFGI